jgi:hypothetical protein
MMPIYMSKMGGFLFLTFGVIVLIASLFTINPIWNYGPYDPSPVSAGTQPDWYIGFADGALRLVPPHLEAVWLDRTWSFNILVPLIAIGIFILLVVAYPFIEAWITGDKREHHIADRPRNAPTRTAIGAAGVTFYASLWAAASSDILATHFSLTMEGVIHALQFTTIVGPFIAYFIAKRVCIALQKKDREIVLHGYESGRIVKLPRWRVHRGPPAARRVRPLAPRELHDVRAADDPPELARQDHLGQRMRGGMSRWFFEDRIAPVTEGRARGVAPRRTTEPTASRSGTGPMSIDTTWLRCPNCLLDLAAIDERVSVPDRPPLRPRQARAILTLLPPGATNDRRRPSRCSTLGGAARQRRLLPHRDALADAMPRSRCRSGADARLADLAAAPATTRVTSLLPSPLHGSSSPTARPMRCA